MSSKKGMAELLAALKEDPSLGKQLEEAAWRIAQTGEVKSDSELYIKAAAEFGFTVSAGELERAMARAEALSEEELALAAGGQSGEDGEDGKAGRDEFLCWQNYYCYSAYYHDEDGNKDRPCFWSYFCAFVVNIKTDRIIA